MIKFTGRRGVFQFLYGFAYLAIGYALTLPATTPIRFIHEMIPDWGRLLIWGTPALIAMITAFIPTTKATVIGFTALSLPLAWRVASYSVSWLIYDLDIRPIVSGIIVYGVMLAALMIVASWPEPRVNIINRAILEGEAKKRWWRRGG